MIISKQDGMMIPVKNIGEMLLEHFGQSAQIGIHLTDKDGKAMLIPCPQIHEIELTGPPMAHINANIAVLAEKLTEQMKAAKKMNGRKL
mgnify:CR=1 FL=1|tara:strand:+ start:1502 stop:1768 length:267 start_codon:yes stop_codon:yes gene_type:complete